MRTFQPRRAPRSGSRWKTFLKVFQVSALDHRGQPEAGAEVLGVVERGRIDGMAAGEQRAQLGRGRAGEVAGGQHAASAAAGTPGAGAAAGARPSGSRNRPLASARRVAAGVAGWRAHQRR